MKFREAMANRVANVLAKGVIGVVLALAALQLAQEPARAAKLEIVFKDGLYGAGIGALIGVAQVASYKSPDNEYYRIPQDAAFGIIIGVIYGFFDASNVLGYQAPRSDALAFYDPARNRLEIGVPALVYSRDEFGTRLTAPLFEARF